ncbi:FGGY-family carbohydrate kinase [Bosea sp. (in: a-proteobacteria)]
MHSGVTVVLDIGKTNSKVLAFDAGLDLVATYDTASISDGTHLDTAHGWAFILASLKEIAKRFRLSAIVPATHGAAFAVMGENGLAHPVVDYEKPVPAAASADYDRLRPDFAESFSPGLPLGLNAGRQLFALDRSAPGLFDEARALVAYPQYWAWKLCGELASDASSLGCHTDLWAPLKGAPSSLAVAMGWDRLLPPVAPAWTTLGETRPALGLPGRCRVLAGIHDSNAALLRYIAGSQEPFALVSTGTWFVCFNTAGDVSGLPAGRDTLANVDALGRPVASARFMGGREYAAIAGLGGQARIEDLRAVLAKGLFALPSFAAGGPFPAARGSMRGTPPGRAEVTALAELYCALMTCECLALTGPVRKLYVDGPFATHPLYLGALATLLPGTRILAAQDRHGTGIGAALLARWPSGAGQLPDYALAAQDIAALDLDLASYRHSWREMVAGTAASEG